MTSSFIILAAGAPHEGKSPALLAEVNGKSLFDWQLKAMSAYNKPQIVIGYAADKFESLRQHAHLLINERWETTKSAFSLLCADLNAESITASYADILYRPNLLRKLNDSTADVTLVYDSLWKQRFADRSSDDLAASEKVIVHNGQLQRAGQNIPVEWANGEFIGLVRFSGKALKYIQELKATQSDLVEQLTLSGLVELLRIQGVSTAVIDVQGDWAELRQPQDIAHFILGTKAETLLRLSSMVKHSTVLEQVAFTVEEWKETPEKIKQKILAKFSKQLLVVRSSAKSEDAFTHSNAGAYTSVLKVKPETELVSAIETVIASYADCQADDQVLVQPMVKDVMLSGVAFTRTLEQGAPFYVVNYDESNDTESITSGYSTGHKCLVLRKDAQTDALPSEALKALVAAIKEVEALLNYDALDIEFALDSNNTVYLLQARPIAALNNKANQISTKHVLELQRNAAKKWQRLQTPAPQVKGAQGLFGIMPDWNPAEIIGTNPGQLAISLYQHLILNEVWATQRAEYGYKDVRPQPLLHVFAGKPYIDIRASFNSFTPKNLSAELTEKLINFYLEWLEKHPHLHDKVEFDVVPTCFGPKFSKWEERLSKQAGLNQAELNELKAGLFEITQNALSRTQQDLDVLNELETRYQAVINNQALDNKEKIFLLLENCKTYGTLPFSHLARSGFVAATFLKEAVQQGWLSDTAQEGFMETVETVSHELSVDAWLTAQGQKTWDEFVQTYGHLRPGTYDITSPAYWDDAERFLKPIVEQAVEPVRESPKIEQWHKEKTAFFTKLRGLGFKATDEQFERFMTQAVEGREKAKFIFSRSLSAALSLIAKEGEKYNLSLKELANISYFDLQAAFNSDLPIANLSEQLKHVAAKNTYERSVSRACQLPPLITSEKDFDAFVLTADKPNFIGSSRVTAKVVLLENNEEQHNVAGCIVLIPQADPGYDWLFGQKIAGLITMYGGANSHMAIRSAEFGLPAAIGVGEQLYNNVKHAKTLELDAANHTMKVIH